jgi:ATP-dependent Clp protease ATP-binding subunit ClpC
MAVFERFTERARQVVVLAQDEARAFRHNYIGTEHLLLGLLREEEGLGARTLENLGIVIEPVRAQVARIVGHGDEAATGQIPFTPRAKRVLELALREGLALGHNYIGTEHLLLGLAREGDGVAMRILVDLGVDAEKIRGAVIAALGGDPSAYAAEQHIVAESRRAARGFRRFPMPPQRGPWGRASHVRRRGLPLLGAVILGWALFGVAAALGLLTGWLIWG